jgi:hypothetical protein
VSCTRTSTGSCIQGGEFCSSTMAGRSGIDGSGRTYVCRDGHWEN